MSSVVVLTKNWRYWEDVDLDRALKLWSKNKIEIVLADDSQKVGSTTIKIDRPIVVRLMEFAGYKVKHEEIGYSKEAVFKRDKNVCQYWHYDENNKPYKHKCSLDERSLDHVIPKVLGGATHSFLNSVTSCTWHNVTVKKGRTPEQAGLKLIAKPFVPKANKGEYVMVQFNYNPNNLAHRIYVEKILGGKVVN